MLRRIFKISFLTAQQRYPVMFVIITTLLFLCCLYANASPVQQKMPIMGTSTVEVMSTPIQVQTNVEVEQKGDNLERLPPVSRYRLELGYQTLFMTTIPLAGCVLLIIIALWCGKGKIKENLIPFFGNGQLGQYIVIILVAGNVCTLAIVGILGSSEVAAIYGGIIGYVLGKKSSNGTSPTERGANGTNSSGQEPKG